MIATDEQRDMINLVTGGLLNRIEANKTRFASARQASDEAEQERAMSEGFELVRQLSEISNAIETKGWDQWLAGFEHERSAKVSALAVEQLASLDAALASCDRTPCRSCDRRREYRRTLVYLRDHPGEPPPEGYMRDDPDDEPERADP
ncbi:MAG: hypothetical protein HYV07_21585 [Deltaproteobacteria bacterium]|nr:hypothetical protein [Deltaproteobacteria bacterium]